MIYHNILQEAEHEKARQKILKSSGIGNITTQSDAIHNDFKRELNFYRQAQATVLEVLPRLKSMGVPTKRPEDYFAQMAKTDDHMNKVCMLHKFSPSIKHWVNSFCNNGT